MPRTRSRTATFKAQVKPLKIKLHPTLESAEKRLSNYPAVFQWLSVGIFVQALVAMLGSLYYSTFGDPVKNLIAGNLFPLGEGFEPCVLCWFARILMYPIVFISYVGMAKQDKRFTDYVLPLSVLGIVLELYHYALQKLPIASHFGCSLENPCNALQVNYIGFITIPFLALIAFIIITGLALANTILHKKYLHSRRPIE